MNANLVGIGIVLPGIQTMILWSEKGPNIGSILSGELCDV